MGDRLSVRTRPRSESVLAEIVGDVVPGHSPADIVTAASQMLWGSPRENYAIQYKSWQQELWAYTKSVGEYGSVMDWFASGISRMTMTAALRKPGLREPELIKSNEDPAVTLMHRLALNAKDGETQYLYKWGRQLGVPGSATFVGYEGDDGIEVFDVKSLAQIRKSTLAFKDAQGKVIKNELGEVVTGFDIRTAPNEWLKLPYNQLVGRIYRPDDELDYEVTSWSRPALTTLREIDLFNRHIVATLLSRLVFNGILFIPQEVTFPVNPQFKDASDPFIAELLAVASRGIKDPGSPASALPFPIRVPAQWIEKFQHMILATGIDPKIIDARAQAIQNLSRQLPSPPEAMTGKGDQNHWNAWKDSEDNVKFYFGPTMEILCGGITTIYLHRMLRAGGQVIDDGTGRRICWYDPSDLIAQPDNSVNAIDARERNIIGNEPYLKILGMDKADMVKPDERRENILTALAVQGMPIPDSFYLLYPEDKPDPVEQAVIESDAMKVKIDSGVVPDPTAVAAGPANAKTGATPGTTKKGPPNGGKTPTTAQRPAAKTPSASKGG